MLNRNSNKQSYNSSVKKMPMTKWFDVGQLLNTGVKVIFSTFIGEQTDKRIIQALASSRKEFYDYTHYHKVENGKLISNSDSKRNEIWIDFIADTGDGFNSTYAVAYYSSNPELKLISENREYLTKRGDILIFGGDEVYPTPSKDNYRKRLTIPFETAFGDDNPDNPPHVFALPGNHDWYDGLTAFTRLFCSDLNRKFGGWYTRQKRSYFAIKLPGNWWLLGSDGQLQSDIDTPQIDYFRRISEKYIEEGDKVILCISQPNWIYAEKYKKYGELYDESDLIYLQKEILSKKNVKVKVYLSGDYHHYRRHEEKNPADSFSRVQKITAGGGGAFLHPTHDADVSLISDEYTDTDSGERFFELKKSYPEVKDSKNLTFRDLLFLFYNPGFGIITALLYVMTAWLVSTTLNIESYKLPESFLENIFAAVRLTSKAFIVNPIVAIWIAAVIIIFIFFTDTHSKLYKYIGGFLHCWAHFTAIFYIGWLSIWVSVSLFGHSEYLRFLFSFSLIFILGWITGSTILGLYLFISQYFFGRHSEESFSALKIQDYKNFLRLHIDKNGTLAIYPVKIDKVPRKWKDRPESLKNKIKSFVIPVDGTPAELIENPVILSNERVKV